MKSVLVLDETGRSYLPLNLWCLCGSRNSYSLTCLSGALVPCQKWVPCLVASPLQWTASRSSHYEKQSYKCHWCYRTRMAWCWTSASSYQLFLGDKRGEVCGSRRLNLVQWSEETHDGTQSSIGRIKTVVNYKKSLFSKIIWKQNASGLYKNIYIINKG